MLYFAYGSNLCPQRLQSRIPRAQQLQAARLDEHQIRFHMAGSDNSAKADAYYTGEHTDHVWGVLYEMPESDRAILDRYESLGTGYEVKSVMVEQLNGGWTRAFAYFALHIDKSRLPYDWYLDHVLRGAKKLSFPELYLDQLKNQATIPDSDHERALREWSISQNMLGGMANHYNHQEMVR